MKRLLCLIVVLQMLQPQPALSIETLPRDIYLQQQESTSCTLCASTMMIRSFLYRNDTDWEAVTEEDVGTSAWTSEGLSWQWEYIIGDHTVNISHESVSSLDQEKLKWILREHPEGIVLYCGGSVHHGVFLIEYVDGNFYCADPAIGYAGEKILLSQSLLADRLGSQKDVLDAVTAYWYIESR